MSRVVDENSLQHDVTTALNGAHRDVDMSPWERIAQANQMVLEAAKDPYIRHAAVEALRGCGDVPRRGGEHLARWVRKNITYAAEAPGVEVLQGPFTTLALRTGDCDDLSITWASLARSVGLDAYVAGISEKTDPEALVHAVGYDNGAHTHWELSLDKRWGGPVFQPLIFRRPQAYQAVWWSPEAHRLGYWVDRGDGYRREEETQPQKEQVTMRYRNPYDAKGHWYDEGGATGAYTDKGGGSDQGSYMDRLLVDPVSAFLNALAGQAPDVILGNEQGLATPPPEDTSYMDLARRQQTQASGTPTWVWGLLGLVVVGGVVIYVVKR